jgi:hypothetical protein
MCIRVIYVKLLTFSLLLASWLLTPFAISYAQAANPNPPIETVRLIFIHHSTGENWLTDGYGNLGESLGVNNYFVSDTNYGWGPEGIGDRTDILNWTEWFRSEFSPIYTDALFNENVQNSNYTRTLADPGGENQVILFKSCFPNSMLEGSPDDPATPGDSLSVGNAKYIYNDLLNFFMTRPDKLFIIITAPPVQDPTYADNARAFNNWLVNDWLYENNYPYNNVAVFDFYNVLTHPENHHRYNPSTAEIEHTTSFGDNTLYYPSEDDHPNPEGSQKATEEFIPLLNIFYNRWLAGGPAELPLTSPETTTPTETSISAPSEPGISAIFGVVDDFESRSPLATEGWQANWDANTSTQISCAPDSSQANHGSQALHINYTIPAGQWGTCTLFFDQVQDWHSGSGTGFYIQASQINLHLEATFYGGNPGAAATYQSTLETTSEMVGTWVYIELTWDQFLRVAWEDNPGTPFDPTSLAGLGFGFSAQADSPANGEIWVDDLTILRISSVEEPQDQSMETPVILPTAVPTTIPDSETKPSGCAGSLAVGLFGIVSLFVRKIRPRP